jgi:hypothetical protein
VTTRPVLSVSSPSRVPLPRTYANGECRSVAHHGCVVVAEQLERAAKNPAHVSSEETGSTQAYVMKLTRTVPSGARVRNIRVHGMKQYAGRNARREPVDLTQAFHQWCNGSLVDGNTATILSSDVTAYRICNKEVRSSTSHSFERDTALKIDVRGSARLSPP